MKLRSGIQLDSEDTPTVASSIRALEVNLNRFYHLQLKSDIDKLLAILRNDLARNLSLSI